MACMGDCVPLTFVCSLGDRWVYVRRCVYVHMYTCVCEHVPVCVHTDVSHCCVDLLNQNAGYFQKTATNLKRKLWWQNVKVCICACSIVQCDVSIPFHFRSILQNMVTFLPSYATDKDVFATGDYVGTEQPPGLPVHAMCVMIRHSPSDCRSLSSLHYQTSTLLLFCTVWGAL